MIISIAGDESKEQEYFRVIGKSFEHCWRSEEHFGYVSIPITYR